MLRTLFRPVGPVELKWIESSGFRKFSPRLPEQPIFYPVLNEESAREIAERGNVPECGIGDVTQFVVDEVDVSQIPRPCRLQSPISSSPLRFRCSCTQKCTPLRFSRLLDLVDFARPAQELLDSNLTHLLQLGPLKTSSNTLGPPRHQALGVPAAKLDEFNHHIVGQIEAIATFTLETPSKEGS